MDCILSEAYNLYMLLILYVAYMYNDIYNMISELFFVVYISFLKDNECRNLYVSERLSLKLFC